MDLAARLWASPEQATLRGNPDVKVPDQRHLCRHCWRIVVQGERGRVLYLFLSLHHREGGVGLPYIWLQGTPAVVWRVAVFPSLSELRGTLSQASFQVCDGRIHLASWELSFMFSPCLEPT